MPWTCAAFWCVHLEEDGTGLREWSAARLCLAVKSWRQHVLCRKLSCRNGSFVFWWAFVMPARYREQVPFSCVFQIFPVHSYVDSFATAVSHRSRRSDPHVVPLSVFVSSAFRAEEDIYSVGPVGIDEALLHQSGDFRDRRGFSNKFRKFRKDPKQNHVRFALRVTSCILRQRATCVLFIDPIKRSSRTLKQHQVSSATLNPQIALRTTCARTWHHSSHSAGNL